LPTLVVSFIREEGSDFSRCVLRIIVHEFGIGDSRVGRASCLVGNRSRFTGIAPGFDSSALFALVRAIRARAQ
jgi:hypothetical protein